MHYGEKGNLCADDDEFFYLTECIFSSLTFDFYYQTKNGQLLQFKVDI